MGGSKGGEGGRRSKTARENIHGSLLFKRPQQQSGVALRRGAQKAPQISVGSPFLSVGDAPRLVLDFSLTGEKKAKGFRGPGDIFESGVSASPPHPVLWRRGGRSLGCLPCRSLVDSLKTSACGGFSCLPFHAAGLSSRAPGTARSEWTPAGKWVGEGEGGLLGELKMAGGENNAVFRALIWASLELQR